MFFFFEKLTKMNEHIFLSLVTFYSPDNCRGLMLFRYLIFSLSAAAPNQIFYESGRPWVPHSRYIFTRRIENAPLNSLKRPLMK